MFPPPASPGNKHADLNNLEDGVEKRLTKRARARGMNAQKKLFLIRECCEHAAEFIPSNKTVFSEMIRDLLKERTDLLKEPRNTVLRWAADRDDLVQKEMDSDAQIDQDDFELAVEQFSARLKTV